MKTTKSIFYIFSLLLPLLAYPQEADTTQARALLTEGISLLQAGNYQKSEEKVTQAAQIWQEAEIWDVYIGSLITIGETKWRRDDLDGATIQIEGALELANEHLPADHIEIANANLNLGIINTIKGVGITSEPYFLKALKIKKEQLGETHLELASIYNALGALHSQVLNYDLSLQYYNQSLNIKKSHVGPEDPSLISSYMNMAYLYAQLHEFTKALDHSHLSVDIAEKSFGKDHPNMIQVYNLHGIVLLTTRRYDAALPFYEKSLEMAIQYLGERSLMVGNMYNNIGNLFTRLEAHQPALSNYRKALSIYEEVIGTDNEFFPQTLENVGKELLATDKPDSALFYFEAAKTIYERFRGFKHAQTARMYRNIGTTLGIKSQYDEALESVQMALSANSLVFEGTATEDNPHSEDFRDLEEFMLALAAKAELLHDRYHAQSMINDLHLSLITYQLCDTVIEAYRRNRHRYDDKILFGDETSNIFEGASAVAKKLYDLNAGPEYAELSFYFSEKNKSAALVEKITSNKIKKFSGVPDALLEREKQLKSERSKHITEIKNVLTKDTAYDTAKVTSLRRELTSINNSLDSLREVFQDDYLQYSQLYQSRVGKVAELQKQIRPNQAFIEYLETKDSLIAFVIMHDQFELLSLKKDSVDSLTGALTQLLNTYPDHQSLDDMADFTKSASLLYNHLMGPVVLKLTPPIDHLIIIPTPGLATFPFELLVVSEDKQPSEDDFKGLSYLLKKYSVSYANSISSALQNQTDHREKRLELLALAPSYETLRESDYPGLRSSFRQAITPLKWNSQEVKIIGQHFAGQTFAGTSATEANFKAGIEDYRIIHLAMHAFVDHEEPMDSKLMFYQDQDSTEDGMLHAYELFDMDLSADMVVLSACETGIGKTQDGEGIMSLGKAFSYAGCPSVITSHWAVDDESTSRLMTIFYQYIAQGQSKDRALRQAKLDFLIETHGIKTHPFFWGGFVVVGNTEPLTNRPSYQWAFIVGMTLLVICFFIARRRAKKPADAWGK